MLQLRFYFGERDRAGEGGRPLEAAVMEACARRGARAAALLRGVTGFGAKHGMRTDRLLTLSEDAPLVAVAVGDAEVVEGLAAEVRRLGSEGLVVLEPVRVVGGRDGGSGGASTTGTATASAAGVAVPVADARRAAEGSAGDVVRATIWGPRGGSESPHVEGVAALHRCGAQAATVSLGVDGVLGRERRRARFVGANRGVPAITVAVGERAKIEAALGEVGRAHLVTVESVVTNCRIETESHHGTRGVVGKSDMDRLSHHSNASSAAPAEATRVTLVTSETASHDGRPLYLDFVDALRREGAPGATALRGVWGFRGRAAPRGDRVLALRRDVPVTIEVVDTAERAGSWLELALSLAGEDDVVESQRVTRILASE
jgi:PII-like signaling protein